MRACRWSKMPMSHFRSNTKSQCLMAGIIAAATLVRAGHWRGERRGAQFLPRQPHRMDRRRARQRNTDRPGFPPAAVRTRPGHVRQGAPLYRQRHVATDGAQPTLRVADLSNPILQPWAREALRKVNERALTATHHVHAQGEMLADRRSGLPALSGHAGLFPPDSRKRW